MIKRIFVFLLMFFALTALYSCSADDFDSTGDDSGNTSSGSTANEDCWNADAPCLKFNEIIYSHPDTEALLDSFGEAYEIVIDGESSYESRLYHLEKCLGLYSDFETMKSLAEIRFLRDKTDALSAEDFAELHKASPMIDFSLQKLMLALEECSDSDRLLSELSAKGLITKRRGKTLLTEAAVTLMCREAGLEADLMYLSAETVSVSYKGFWGNIFELEAIFSEEYGKNSPEYDTAMKKCREKCLKKSKESCEVISIELIKLRNRLAQEMGYKSYCDYIYGEFSDYTEDEAMKYIDGVMDYAIPIYGELSESFERYFFTNVPTEVKTEDAIASLGRLYTDMDNELGIAYSHMIGGSLYHLANNSERNAPHRAPYLQNHGTPFVFINSSSTVLSYTDIAKSFGSFSAAHINKYGDDLSLSVISSEGLGFLTLASLSQILPDEEYKYLLYSELDRSFSNLIYTAYYAKLEQQIYSLPYSLIEGEIIDRIAKELAEQMGITNIVLDPKVGEAYIINPLDSTLSCISMSVGLDIFLNECNGDRGLLLYRALLCSEAHTSLGERLSGCSLRSPFEESYAKELYDELFFLINGYYYYEESESNPDKT